MTRSEAIRKSTVDAVDNMRKQLGASMPYDCAIGFNQLILLAEIAAALVELTEATKEK